MTTDQGLPVIDATPDLATLKGKVFGKSVFMFKPSFKPGDVDPYASALWLDEWVFKPSFKHRGLASEGK